MTHPDYLSGEPAFAGPEFEQLLDRLSAAAPSLEDVGSPTEQFRWLADAGVLGWVIPQEYGGSEITQEELICGYEQLAIACLTTCFVLTQRNGACQRIAGSESVELKADLLPRLAAGELFATVGISHLTTSRQHLARPAVEVDLSGDRIELNGEIPWVTAAELADYVVTGGTCADGRQVLIALPTAVEGVTVRESSQLLALTESRTASISVDHAGIPMKFLLAGPVEGVMTRGQGGGTGSVATSSLAVGVSARALAHLAREAERRPELEEIIAPFQSELNSLHGDLYAAARGESAESNPGVDTASIRRRANSLVLRTTQAALGASKGAGFVRGHPAERAVREAMFFLVWSCPQPVLNAALREFACIGES